MLIQKKRRAADDLFCDFFAIFAVLYLKTDRYMEIEITYKAWDGMEFKDPYVCEEYEKALSKFPGTVANLLKLLDKYEETYLFSGTLIYKEKDKEANYYSRTNIDFSNLYEGEMVTQAMKDAQMMATNTVGDVRNHFSKVDPGTPYGGTFIIQKDHNSSQVIFQAVDCKPVFKEAWKQKS